VRRFDDVGGEEPPEDLTAWLAAGLRRTAALAWRRWNFTLDEAIRWRAAGVPEALAAARWQAAAVGPDTVGEWQAAGITAAEAIRWHEFGIGLEQARQHHREGRTPESVFTAQRGGGSSGGGTAIATPGATVDLGRAVAGMGGLSGLSGSMRRFLDAGVSHQVMASYLQSQWVDEAAVRWARCQIQAWDAKLWLALGLTAAEAAALHAAGQTPAQVVRDWWRAGIPFDEVADWIGAGLSATEAARQRASGTTVQQAAALRALRREGPA
jgi:hypothetical protein